MNNDFAASACTGKVAFETFTLANAVATRKGLQQRDRRICYHCQHCHQWHLGTDNGRATKERHERKQKGDSE